MKNRRKKVKEYDILLKKRFDRKDYVKINRKFKEREENISGLILTISKKFLLIQIEEEFLLNGYAIIRKDQFDNLVQNKFTRTLKNILKKEGVFEKDYGIDTIIDLISWQTIFKDLRKFDYHVIIECEDLNEPDFVIGPIKRTTKDKVSVQYYDPNGLLDYKLTTINYDDITLAKFCDRYTTTFRKYLKAGKEKIK